MTTYHWTAGSANWTTAADWSPSGGPPTSADDAIIDAAGTPYTVTITSSDSVANLTLISGVVLAIQQSGVLNLFGSTIHNAGTVSLDAGGGSAELVIQSASVTLDP